MVDNGRVTLLGRVPNHILRQEAELVVSGIAGVEGVTDNIVVSPAAPTLSDKRLLRSINESLFWSATVDDAGVDVKVDNGVVTLTGKVDDFLARHMAEELAYRAGAVKVQNRLALPRWSLR